MNKEMFRHRAGPSRAWYGWCTWLCSVFNESCLGRKAAAGHQAGVGGLTQNLVRLLAGGATLVARHATDLE
ncbi:hypothetical protein [Deinococcus alpinitundrae]|uniref:hypothetical protein n=1 Tax=Deinococcus alpinitundrae TaxID=468913 RepID=UPI00137996EE|nr:hypothetical protein [Deinococcus alpinitundrae]